LRSNIPLKVAELRLRKFFLQVAELRLRTPKKVAHAHLWLFVTGAMATHPHSMRPFKSWSLVYRSV
jgi:hypothetical protein